MTNRHRHLTMNDVVTIVVAAAECVFRANQTLSGRPLNTRSDVLASATKQVASAVVRGKSVALAAAAVNTDIAWARGVVEGEQRRVLTHDVDGGRRYIEDSQGLVTV